MRARFCFAFFLLVWAALSPNTPAAEEENPLVHEVTVNASAEEVWAAFTTKEGLESWNVAHAEIKLKIGGKMRTHYDPKGKIGDARTIENTILAFDPRRMLSIRVSKAPEGFPFPNAIKSTWTVIYFEAVGAQKTRVRSVGLGYGTDEESKKMREFFDRGNRSLLKRLEKRFAAKTHEK